jgi:hypothetical protein
MLMADRTNDLALAETAVRQIETAYETLRGGGQEAWAAVFEAKPDQGAGDPRPARFRSGAVTTASSSRMRRSKRRSAKWLRFGPRKRR